MLRGSGEETPVGGGVPSFGGVDHTRHSLQEGFVHVVVQDSLLVLSDGARICVRIVKYVLVDPGLDGLGSTRGFLAAARVEHQVTEV